MCRVSGLPHPLLSAWKRSDVLGGEIWLDELREAGQVVYEGMPLTGSVWLGGDVLDDRDVVVLCDG